MDEQGWLAYAATHPVVDEQEWRADDILDPVYGDLYAIGKDSRGDDLDEFDADGQPQWELKASNFPLNIWVKRSLTTSEGGQISFGEAYYAAIVPRHLPAVVGDLVRLRDPDATMYNVEGGDAGAGSFFHTKQINLTSSSA